MKKIPHVHFLLCNAMLMGVIVFIAANLLFVVGKNTEENIRAGDIGAKLKFYKN